jgi:hypothetical protein
MTFVQQLVTLSGKLAGWIVRPRRRHWTGRSCSKDDEGDGDDDEDAGEEDQEKHLILFHT